MLVTAGLSLAAFGAGTQVRGRAASNNGNLPDFSGTPKEITESGGGWKYLPIDPQKAADDSYYYFADGACHYSSFRAIVTNVAKALLATGNKDDAMLAEHYLAFPFYMMVYGQAGLAFYGSLCGAINGCAAAISVFVPDRTDKFTMIQDINVYHEVTPLPIYAPKIDPCCGTGNMFLGEMPKTVANSILCHPTLDKWVKGTDYTFEGSARAERCNRLTSDIVIRTVRLLNEYHSVHPKKNENLMSLTPETQSCVECHSHAQGRYDVLTKMSCATCHSEPPTDRLCPRK